MPAGLINGNGENITMDAIAHRCRAGAKTLYKIST